MARENGENENQVPAVIFFSLCCINYYSLLLFSRLFCIMGFWMEFVCRKSYASCVEGSVLDKYLVVNNAVKAYVDLTCPKEMHSPNHAE